MIQASCVEKLSLALAGFFSLSLPITWISCKPDANTKETLQPATLPTTLFQSRLTRFKTFAFPPEFPARGLGQGEVFPANDGSRFSLPIPPPVRPNYYFTGKLSSSSRRSDSTWNTFSRTRRFAPGDVIAGRLPVDH